MSVLTPDGADEVPEAPMAQFVAASDDEQVVAIVSARLEVLQVRVADDCPPEVAEQGIVQAVNRALAKAEAMPVNEIVKARDARMSEFNALMEGLESDVSRARTRRADRRRNR